MPLLVEADASATLQSLHISKSARQPWPGPQTKVRMFGRSVMFISAWIRLSMGWTMNGMAAGHNNAHLVGTQVTWAGRTSSPAGSQS